MTTHALFISGPRDGQRVVLGHAMRALHVPMRQEVSPVLYGVEGQVVLTPSTFTYVGMSIPYLADDTCVYIPEDWIGNGFIDPMQRVLTALVHGYVGRSQ